MECYKTDNNNIIIFYEPFEIMIKDTTRYLQKTKMIQYELLYQL